MMKNNCGKKFILFLSVCACIGISSNVYAAELQFEEKNLNEKYIEWLELSEEEREGKIAPSPYIKNIENDSNLHPIRIYNRKLGASSNYIISGLKIKNQMQTESCWAFATTTQLESYMAKIKNRTVEYSPKHIEYATSRTFSDGENPNGFNREVNDGGNYYLSYAYMTSGHGPVLETDMPFDNSTSKIKLEELNKTVQAQLEEYVIFPSIYKEKNDNVITYSNGQTGDDRIEYSSSQIANFRNNVKDHIVRYGAVGAISCTTEHQFFSNQDEYILSKAYNCDDSSVQADHAVAIVGWDDGYLASNFNSDHMPTSSGAWIIQNSYGTEISDGYGNTYSVFDNGLLYISYEDFLIEQSMFGIVGLDDIDYNNIYQYDELGMSSLITVSDISSGYSANVFEKEEGTEYLTEIGLYTTGKSGYTYEIYVNSEDGTLDKNKLDKVQSASNITSDYVTIKLNNPIKLSGDEFIVAIKYINNNNFVDIPVEGKIALENKTWNTASSKSGESFVSIDGENWTDLKEMDIIGISDMNACIKAFTINKIKPESNVSLTSNVYNITDRKNITKISPKTSLVSFKNNIQTTGNIKLYDSEGNAIETADIVTTGMKMKLVETSDYYSIVVRGDVNGDGKITTTDLIKLKKCIAEIENLTGEYEIAGDVNLNGGITITDVTQLKQALCEIITF